MAYNQEQARTYSAQCGEDLSNNQYQFVKISTGELLYSCDDNQFALGILTDVPSLNAQGQYCGTVAVEGITRLAVGARYPIGTFLCPHTDGTANGYGYSVADAGSSEQYIRAFTLQASDAAYDVVAVKLIDPHPDVYSRGATGIQGPVGLTGNTGIQGLTGLALGGTGIQGVTGFYGQTGILGQTGIQGLVGNTGIQGLTGLYGTTGIQGLTGNTGIQGLTGIYGMTGIQGDQGNTGIQGNTTDKV